MAEIVWCRVKRLPLHSFKDKFQLLVRGHSESVRARGAECVGFYVFRAAFLTPKVVGEGDSVVLDGTSVGSFICGETF